MLLLWGMTNTMPSGWLIVLKAPLSCAMYVAYTKYSAKWHTLDLTRMVDGVEGPPLLHNVCSPSATYSAAMANLICDAGYPAYMRLESITLITWN